jgi:hypothetical protein
MLTIPFRDWARCRRDGWASTFSPRESTSPRLAPEHCCASAKRERKSGQRIPGRVSRSRRSKWYPNGLNLISRKCTVKWLHCCAPRMISFELNTRKCSSRFAAAAAIHRKWLPCDSKIVNAWISGRYPYTGEKWDQFRERFTSRRFSTGDAEGRENVVVFTSATPLAIWTGLSLQILDERVMQLAGVLYNASYTVLRLREGQLRLFTFNAAPHLATDGMRTQR